MDRLFIKIYLFIQIYSDEVLCNFKDIERQSNFENKFNV